MGKLSASSQDYLEAILELSLQDDKVRSVDIAQKLNVSRASVNKAIGVLKQAGYIMQERYSDIYLTESGRQAALDVKERHIALKSFLVNSLGVSELTAEKDACKMEHIISDESFHAIKEHVSAMEKMRPAD